MSLQTLFPRVTGAFAGSRGRARVSREDARRPPAPACPGAAGGWWRPVPAAALREASASPPAPESREPGRTAVPVVMCLKINTAPHPRGENPRVLIFSDDDVDEDAAASPPPSSLLLPVSDSFRTFISLGVPVADVAEVTAGPTHLLCSKSFVCHLALAPSWLSANSFQL